MNIPEKTKRLIAPLPKLVPAKIIADGNESFEPMPIWLAAEIMTALAETPLNRYPDPLARKVCEPAAAYYGVQSSQITAGCGSDELIQVIVNAFVPAGGRMLLCEPDFGSYRFCAELREMVCVAKAREDGKPDLSALLAVAQQGDCVMLSNPCNPTGQGIEREAVLAFVRQAPCLVVIDEAYMDFWDQSVADAIGECDNLIVLRTASKSVGLASIRLGFALACETLTEYLRTAKLPYNVTGLTQSVGAVVYGYPEMLRENAKTLARSARMLYNKLLSVFADREEFTVTDTLTNFVLLSAPDTQKLYEFMLAKEIRVRILRGEKPLLRITAGTEAENDAIAAALREAIQ